MLLSSSVIKNTKISEGANKEIVTAREIDIKPQTPSDIGDMLKQSGDGVFENVDKVANTFIENAKSAAESLRNKAI